MLPASKLRCCKMPGKSSSSLKLIGICTLGLNYWFWKLQFMTRPHCNFYSDLKFHQPLQKKSLDVFQSDLKTRIIWVCQQTFEEIRFLNRCVRAKKNQARLPAPIALIGDFPIYQENHSGDTSTYTLKTMRKWTVRIKSFIFCCCGPLNSQNEAQEVSEKLKKL